MCARILENRFSITKSSSAFYGVGKEVAKLPYMVLCIHIHISSQYGLKLLKADPDLSLFKLVPS